jgi:hypothetical protein
LKEQAAQIQKVSAQLEASKTAPQVVNNPKPRLNKEQRISQSAVTLHRVAAFCFGFRSPLFELARVLVRFEHVAS